MLYRAILTSCLCLFLASELPACAPQRSATDAPAGEAQWQLQPDVLVADGNSAADFQVTVLRPSGDAWPGARVVVRADTAGVLIEQPDVTDAQGTAPGRIRCQEAGTVMLLAQVQDGPLWWPLSNAGSLFCLAADAVPVISLLPDHDVGAADLDAPVFLTLYLRDAYGRPLANQTVTLTTTRSGDSVAPSTATTGPGGEVQVALTATSLGTATVVARTSIATASVTVQFIAEALDLAASTWVARPGTVIADGQSRRMFDLTVRDSAGRLVPYATVAFTSDMPGDVLSPQTAATDGHGLLSVALTGTKQGSRQVSAITHRGNLTAASQLVAGPLSAAGSTVILSPNVLTADGVATATVTVFTADAQGNFLANQALTLAASGTGNVLGASSGVSDANGLWTTTIKTTQAQTTTITATAGGVSWSGNVIFQAGSPNAALSTLTASPNVLVADNNATASLTAIFRDAFGNAISTGAVHWAGQGPQETLGQTISSLTSGSATNTLRSTLAHAVPVTAQLGGVVLGANVTFVPGAPSAAQSALVASPNSLTTDGSSPSTITAIFNDAFGNPISGSTVTFSASGSNNTLGAASGATNGSGLATTTLLSTRAEIKSLTASSGGITLTGNVLFVAGSPNASMSTLSITPSIRVADGIQAITASAHLQDDYANPVSGLAASVAVSGASTTALPISGATDASGSFSSSITTAVVQTQNITLTAGPFTTSINANFTLGPPDAAASSLVAAPNTALPSDGVGSSTLTLSLKDSLHRALPSQPVRFSAAGSKGTLTSLSSITDGLGMAQTALTSMYAGNIIAVAQSGGLALNANARFSPKTPFCSTPVTLGQRPLSLSLGDWVSRIDTADLNQDGNLDLVYTLANSSGINIFYGQGYGKFASALSYSGSIYTNNVAIADFDNDQYLDIAQSVSSNYISILRGQASPSMIPQGTVSIGTSVIGAGVCAGDVNKDGKVDLVSVYNSPSGFVILLGDGAGNFALAANYPVSGTVSRCAIADFDGDGNPDIAVTNYGQWTVDVYYGNTDGSFSAAKQFAVGSNAFSLEVGFINQDSLPDIAVANNVTGGTISVLLGLSGQNFQPVASYAVGSSPSDHKLIDINGDSNNDIVVNNSNGGITYLLGRGDGTFAPASYASSPGKTSRITVADFDKDGALDVAYALTNAKIGGITFATSPGVLPSLSGAVGGALGAGVTRAVMGADFNKDGFMDVIGIGTNQNAVLFSGMGTGQFAAGRTIPGSSAVGRFGTVGDINGDGNMDAVLANYSLPRISVLINTGDGNFAINSINGSTSNPSSAYVAVADVNGDGLGDIFHTVLDGNVWLYLSTSASGNAFAARMFATGSSNCQGVRLSDIDNDGFQDLIVGCTSLVTMRGDGTGNYSNAVLTDTGNGQRAMRPDVADINGDGYLDVAVSDFAKVTIYMNQKDGSFIPFSITTPNNVGFLEFGDLNGDGHADLIVTGNPGLFTYLGAGDGTFGAAQIYPGTGLYGLLLTDLNNDKKTDVMVASLTDGLIEYLSSGCTPHQ